jgi:cell division protein ZapA
MKQMEVTILGQSYLLACPEGGEDLLRQAVSRVDQEMSAIRDAGKVKARERMAVLAALNLAYLLAEQRQTPAATVPVPASPAQPRGQSRGRGPAGPPDFQARRHPGRRRTAALAQTRSAHRPDSALRPWQLARGGHGAGPRMGSSVASAWVLYFLEPMLSRARAWNIAGRA